MPWVIAIMMFLTVLAAAAGLGLASAAARLDEQIGGRVTVQIVEANPASRAAQAAAAAAAIRRLPGVVAVRPVPEAEISRLLEPWLGAGGLDERYAGAGHDRRRSDARGAIARLDELRRAVAAAAPAARVDDNAQWLAPLASLIGALKWLAAGLVLLMVGATAATVVLAARAALDTHRGDDRGAPPDGRDRRAGRPPVPAPDRARRPVRRAGRLHPRRSGADRHRRAGLGARLGAARLGQRARARLGDIGRLALFGVLLAMLVARLTILRALGRML